MKDINIVYVNYHTRDDIMHAVRSAFDDAEDCPYSVQITVVDNSRNADNMRGALASAWGERVKYVDPGSNVGFGMGNTVGWQSSDARYYLALNRDTIIPPNTKVIQRMVAFMDNHPKIGCIGPKLVNMDGSLQYACYRFDLPSILIKPMKQIQFHEGEGIIKRYIDRLLMKDFSHDETRPVDWVLGAAMMARREVIDDIGWFDPRYFMYMEDCDWCRTMWERGWPVYYVHDIVIQHRYARESARVPGVWKALWKNKLARVHLKSWVQYLWKWRGQHRYL